MSVVDRPAGPTRRQTSAAAQRGGYVVAAIVNGVLLWLLAVEPGWRAVPFLTEDAAAVVPLVGASLAAGIVANGVYVLVDSPVVRAVGEMVVTGIGLVALVATWRVFPFAFTDPAVDWEYVTRVVLVFAMVGSVVGIVVALVRLVLALARPASAAP
ncbi:hypothetical protein [Cellulomonas fimi]|uniref:Uncharacterized protein n=1 Tax=Cellulomonas fimi (strain ATCC 484 / DSM 20113 / JCM 1341 / CCUG 24087 / LMG 16345 / NBRC 15513 / NCIMB 8980 / NCTC 7547 / NRS-133) TaxID=590998 RepID=F4H346_CELFA|nr:hypothetical protein [Cellulomonas fimi]AEE47664.1 hypothetical protein Celf_3554 [Cellulomonas fimi ATCC 484]NNH07420.1 hypothetical protein [Cellulomonas fimi]VEH36751.1 Uncharacterised protein [Cellulomonas fimi]